MELEPGFKLSEAGPIPEDWEAPEMLAHLKQRATYGIVKAGVQSDVGVPMLRGGDIQDGNIGTGLPCVSPKKSEEFKRTVLQEGDVVIALVGYPGESARVPASLAGANISRAVGLLRPERSMHPDFLVSYLNSARGREQTLRPSAGSAQIVVNLDALNKLPIPRPSPDEQQAIAAAATSVDAWIAAAEAEAAKLEGVKAAAMDALLSPTTRLPGFTGSWGRRRFGDLVQIRNRKVQTFGNELASRCIDLENINPGSGSITGFIDLTKVGSLRYSFQPGDVLFGRLRSYLKKYWLAE